MKPHESNLYHNGSLQARDRKTRYGTNEERNITWLITKGCVWFIEKEIEMEHPDCFPFHLNLKLNSTHNELVRVRKTPLGHKTSTDSVKIPLVIYIITDLQRDSYNEVCFFATK